MPARVWRCGDCSATYRVKLLRCPRCHGPELEETDMAKISRDRGVAAAGVPVGGPAQDAGEVSASAEAPAPAPAPDARPDGVRRPPVNAKKAEHAAWAAEVYGWDAEALEAEHTKEELLGLLDDLEAGRLVVRDGLVVAPEDDGDGSDDEVGPDPVDVAVTRPDGDPAAEAADSDVVDAPGDGPDPDAT